jgi:oxalate---CoA ligase
VPLSHGNLAASLDNIVRTYELTPADRSLLVMPLFHVHGLMAGDRCSTAVVAKLAEA